MQNGKPLPGVAQVAIQQGRYVGRFISKELSGRKPPRPFRYFDKGNMAVVGKNFAVMESGRIRMAGPIAWFAWGFNHLLFLPQLQSRLRVERQWIWTYFTGQRSSRLVTEAPDSANCRLQQFADSDDRKVHWTSKSMTEQRTWPTPRGR